jgi:hypothetical protein
MQILFAEVFAQNFKTILKRHYINQHSMTSKQMKMTSIFKTSAPKEPKTFRQCLSDFFLYFLNHVDYILSKSQHQ